MHMDAEIKDTEIRDTEIKDTRENIPGNAFDFEALTLQEKKELLNRRREKADYAAVWVTVCFLLVSLCAMTGFKLNEGFFEANSRLGLLMESLKEERKNLDYPKINIPAKLLDTPGARLIVPLVMPVGDENIVVTEEFLQKKIVITLKDSAGCIDRNPAVTGDTGVMEAVGIYRQNTDIVIEVYCNDTYVTKTNTTKKQIEIEFDKVRSKYSDIGVIYLPYQDRDRFIMPEWQEKLNRLSEEGGIKLYFAYRQNEEYDEQDVIDFANEIKAELLLGVEVRSDDELHTPESEVVCNTKYYMNGYDSIDVAVLMAEAFVKNTPAQLKQIAGASEDDILICGAKLPAALIRIVIPPSYSSNVENEFRLNESIVNALEQTVKNTVKSYMSE